VADSEKQLHSVLAALEQCRSDLADGTSRETAQLVSVAILQLRMKLNRIADAELEALCDALTPDRRPAKRSQEPVAPQGRRPRAQLKLVK
jgi:hypothetical protein